MSHSEQIFEQILAGMPGYQPAKPREYPVRLFWPDIRRALQGEALELRLPVNPQPTSNGHEWYWNYQDFDKSPNQTGWLGIFPDEQEFLLNLAKHCPAGPRLQAALRVGDTLWVQEKHEFWKPRLNWLRNNERVDTEGAVRLNGDIHGYVQPLDFNPAYNKKRSATQLPRFASRLDLRVAALRAERLHAVSDERIARLGFDGVRVDDYRRGGYTLAGDGSPEAARLAYAAWWNYRHPGFAWETDPFVFVLNLEVTRRPKTPEELLQEEYPNGVPTAYHLR